MCQAAAAVLLALASTALAAPVSPTKPPADSVVLAVNNWPSQVVGTHVLKHLLEATGARVTLNLVAIDLQLAALGAGELHVQSELRESVAGEAFEDAVRARRVIRAGSHAAMSREGWWYPEYAAKLCPGLPRWQALKDCAAIFGARFLDGPKTWKHRDRERIEALGLGYAVEHAESADALLETVRKAFSERRPILVFRWSPHWMEADHPGRFVEFPPFNPNCVTDPGWGPNPNAIYDCDLYKPGRITKAVWSELPQRHPCAFALVKRVSFTSRDLVAMEALVVADRLSPEEAASEWLRRNRARSQSWIPPCRTKR